MLIIGFTFVLNHTLVRIHYFIDYIATPIDYRKTSHITEHDVNLRRNYTLHGLLGLLCCLGPLVIINILIS